MRTILSCKLYYWVLPNRRWSLLEQTGLWVHLKPIFTSIALLLLLANPQLLSGQSDKDSDGVFDTVDLDSDNDGISDMDEGLECGILDLTLLNGQTDALNAFNNAMLEVAGSLVQINDPLTFVGGATLDEFVVADDHDIGNVGLLLGVNSEDPSQYMSTIYTFSEDVCGFNARLVDIDRTDAVEIYGFLDGMPVTFTPTTTGICLNYDNANTVESTCNVQANPGNGNVDEHAIEFIFNGCIDSLEFRIYDQGPGEGGSFTFIPTPQPVCTATDTDMDGVADYLDLDSDNDGISDAIEACGDITVVLENCTLDFDGNGDYVIVNGMSTGMLVGTCTDAPIDTDGDGIPDFQDLDSDGDGCSDAMEACTNGNPNVNDSIVSDGYVPPANGVDPCGLVFDVDGTTFSCEVPPSLNYTNDGIGCVACDITLVSNAVCTNADGSASASSTGGNAPFTFLWNNGETTMTATALPAGEASVTVTDACGSTSTCVLTIPMDDCPECTADAGMITNAVASDCLADGGTVSLMATPAGDAIVPTGFSSLYVLTMGSTLTIIQTNATPDFTVDAEGMYTIHTLVYDPATLDLTTIVPGTTMAAEVLALIAMNDICADLDAVGAAVTVMTCDDTCIADAGTITNATASDCLAVGGTVSLSATPTGDAVVPVGYTTLYVLTMGSTLTIIQTNATTNFTIDAIGMYTIHTLVYDPATLDLTTIVPGTTMAAEVLALIAMNDICADLDAVGAAVTVMTCDDTCIADAGTITNATASDCLADGGTVSLSATPTGDAIVPVGYTTLYVLTMGSALTITQTNSTPNFIVSDVGDYTIHTLVYDPATLDLTIIVPGTTMASEVLALIAMNDICADLDAVGSVVSVADCDMTCIADAGTITNATVSDCLDGIGTVTLSATPVGDAIVPAGFTTLYVLTMGSTLTIAQTNSTPNFIVNAIGEYTIHTLVYDPATLDLTGIVPGTTMAAELIGTIMTNDICADLDAVGAGVTVVDCGSMCDADAGTLSNPMTSDCLMTGEQISLTATPDGNAVVPAGYTTLYVLTTGTTLTILNTSTTPEFMVSTAGNYTIHTLVFDPVTLDLSNLVPGVTTGGDILNLINANDICADLDVVGVSVVAEICELCEVDPGGLSNGIALGCLEEGGTVPISATSDGTAIVPAGFTLLYVLTQGEDLVVLDTGISPNFTVSEIGLYTIHTLVFDVATLDLSQIVPGVTTGQDVLNLIMTSGACAALDVSGAALRVTTCDCVSLNCYGKLNVSLGADCQAIISATLGSPNINADNESEYSITIKVHDEAIPGNILTAEHIGAHVTFQIDYLNPECRNSCWGTLMIEDKFKPELVCSDTIAIMNCIESIEDPGPTILNECGNDQIMIVDELVETLQCDPDYIKRIIRTYVAKDEMGNKSEPCTQEILIERFPSYGDNPDAYQLADNFTVQLGNALACGMPADTSVTGYPTYEGRPLEELMALDCNVVFIMKEDTLVNFQCKQMIIREWGLFDWNCQGSDTLFYQTQLIEFFDDEAPVLLLPVEDFSSSTGGSECSGYITLPTVHFLDNCNEVTTSVSYPHGFINNYTEPEPVHLDLGPNEIIYTGTDACGNVTRDTLIVTVEDMTPPVAICKVGIAVSLTVDGKAVVPAEVFDDSSYDDCGLQQVLVRKMNPDLCGLGQDTLYQESLTFCCEEIDAFGGTEVMVVVRVIDKQGLYNECMISVQLQDKGTLVVEGLPDITVSCEFPFPTSNLNVFGSIVMDKYNRQPIIIEDSLVQFDGPAIDGYYAGSCFPMIQEDIVDDMRNECGLGKLTRRITIASGSTEKYVEQMITVVGINPFYINYDNPLDSLDDIIWPEDVIGMTELNMCDADDYAPHNLPEGYQEPVILQENGCGLVAASITNEEIFSQITDPDIDACFKILREWTVIDWCQTNGSNGPKQWTYTQVIEVTNETAPIVMCSDIVVESVDNECGPEIVVLTASATDDCSGENLVFSYIIDFYGDDYFDQNGVGINIEKEFPIGEHIVYWQVEDKCGNVSETCEQLITIRNTKSPPAICIQGISTDLILMDLDNDGVGETPMSIVTPHVIHGNKKDSIDCLGEHLIFSFSSDTTDVIREFDCSMVGEQTISLYVTDSQGNQTFCTSTIDIQDNMDLCDDVMPPDCDIAAICNDVFGQGISTNLVLVDLDNDGIAETPQSTITTDEILGINKELFDCFGEELVFSFSSDTSDVIRVFDCTMLGEQAIFIYITDSQGNQTFCTTTIDIQDNMDLCEEMEEDCDIVAICKDIEVSIQPNGIFTVRANTIYDGPSIANCVGGSFDFRLGPDGISSRRVFDCDELGDHVLELFLFSRDSLVSTCLSTVTIADPNEFCNQVCVEPIAECRDDVTINLDANGNAAVVATQVFNGNADLDCNDQPLIFSFDNAGDEGRLTFDCNDVGEVNYTLFVINSSGNSTRCETSLMVTDTNGSCVDQCLDPVAECMSTLTLNLNANGMTSVTTAQIYSGSETVDCEGVPLVFAFDSSGDNNRMAFNCNDLGNNTVSLFIVRSNGNSSSCESTIVIEDTNNFCDGQCFDPIAECIDTFSLDINAVGATSVSAALLFTGDSNFDCDGNQIEFAYDDLGMVRRMAFNCNTIGDRTVTMFAIDNDGNTTSCQSVLHIVDSNNNCDNICRDPIAECVESVSVNINANGEASLSVLQVFSGDSVEDCNGENIILSFSSSGDVDRRTYSCNTIGDQTLTLFAINRDGTMSSCMTSVSVFDSNNVCDEICMNPIAMCEPNLSINLGFDGMTRIAAQDLYSGAAIVDCDLNGVTFSFSPNPDNGLMSFDCTDVGQQSLNLFVTGVNGSQTSCTSVIRVTDTEMVCCNAVPILVCQPQNLNLNFIDNDNDGEADDAAITLTATDLRGDGSDLNDCDGNPLRFSLSSNTNNVERVFDCSHLGQNTVQLWATNGAGFSTFCTTTVTIEDPDDECPAGVAFRGVLEGNVATPSSVMIDNVEVSLRGNAEASKMTDQEGHYAFKYMPYGGAYVVKPEKNDNPTLGVTTLDLVMIQRHILGKQLLDSPYKILAADVDESETISANDIIDIRRLILGLEMQLPKTNSWRFVTEDNVFFDPENPYWSIVKDKYEIYEFAEDMEVNFIGVKMGDVNEDALVQSEVRSNHLIRLEMDNVQMEGGHVYQLDVRASMDIEELHGMQFTLDHPGLEIINIQGANMEMSTDVFRSNKQSDQTAVSWIETKETIYKQNEVLFTIIAKAKQDVNLSEQLTIASSWLHNETYSYADLQLGQSSLVINSEKSVEFLVKQNMPNPWSDVTTIQFTIPESGLVNMVVWNLNGEAIYRINKEYTAGEHQIHLQEEDLGHSGIYVVELMFDGNVHRQRILLME